MISLSFVSVSDNDIKIKVSQKAQLIVFHLTIILKIITRMKTFAINRGCKLFFLWRERYIFSAQCAPWRIRPKHTDLLDEFIEFCVEHSPILRQRYAYHYCLTVCTSCTRVHGSCFRCWI